MQLSAPKEQGDLVVPVGRSGCLLVHIPKCAGTSIEVALGVADEYPDIGLQPTSTKHHLSRLFGGGLQHLTIREIRRNFPEVMTRPGLHSISIVRDPVERFVSHFLWKHHRFSDVQVDDKSVLNALTAEVEHLVALSRSLDVFDWPFDGLEYCEGDAQAVGVNDIQRHLLPQCSFLFDSGTVRVDAIYPIENIDTLEQDLRRRGALGVPIPQRMVGRASKTLRQKLPASAEEVIRDVYRHDARLHAHVREVSDQAGQGYCPGAAIDIKRLTGDMATSNLRPTCDPAFAAFPRKLWMYWHQGWDKAPLLVRHCVESWIRRNPSWQVNLLTAETLRDVIEIPALYKDNLALPLAALSDVIRVQLLAQYGGAWADATTWCARPLDEWLMKVMANTGLFAYAKPAPDRPLSSWFIAATPQHYVMQQLRQAIARLWTRVIQEEITLDVTDDPHSKDYFWFHRIFAELLKDDPVVAERWDRCTQVKADEPHYLQNVGLLNPTTPEVEFHIRNKLTNVYKLTRRIQMPGRIEGTVLDSLLRTL